MTSRDERKWSLYCGQVQTGSDGLGQVRTGVKRYFSSTASRTLSKFSPPPNLRAVFSPYLDRSSLTLRSGGNSASSRFNWHKVWTGVKCNFSWEHFRKQYLVRNLSLSRVRMWNFTRIGRKTKKLWLSIIPAQRLPAQPGLRPPQRCVNCNFPSPEFNKPYGVGKFSISEAVPAWLAKIFFIFCLKS